MPNTPRDQRPPATTDPGVLGDFARWLSHLADTSTPAPDREVAALQDVHRFYHEAARWVRDVEDEMRQLCGGIPATAADAVAAENTAAALSRIGGRVSELVALARHASTPAPPPAPQPPPAHESPADDLRGRVDQWRQQLREQREAQRQADAAKRREFVDKLRRDKPHEQATPTPPPTPTATPTPAPALKHPPLTFSAPEPVQPQAPAAPPRPASPSPAQGPRFRRVDR